MFETFIGNKNHRLLCFLCFVLSIGFLQAQDQKTIPDIEKIYLHTDKSIYFIGEDLWYKAYTVRASNNLLFENSNILYVELIDPNSEIIARNKTKIEIGLGRGDFQLTDSLGVKPGVYQLRAYTNWNRNFGENFVFKKNIQIIDVFESNSKTITEQKAVEKTKTIRKTKTNVIDTSNNYKIDFFPEGGSLLENVSSIVGFKAVDDKDNPIDIKGDIYNSDNQLVVSFSSAFDGMGKFQIIPLEGKKYYAKIQSLEGIELQENLPKVEKQGYLLSYKSLKGKNIISILTNEATLVQNPNVAVTVVCKSKGVSYLENTLAITQTTVSFELEKEITSEGISQITLYDSNSKPQSERLIYIEKEKELNVELSTDKPTYKPNEKTAISISSKSRDGVAKSGSFSLSVTDRNGVEEDNGFDSTISSYFLIESDIRGKVHHPGYYFDTTNFKRLEHLENLLLTQGWRDFLWKTIPKVNDTKNYIAEKGIYISGKVKQLFGDKAKENYTIGLVLLNLKHINTFKTSTDSIGKFKFENLKFSEKMQMTLSSKDEKGKFRGEIVLDSVGEAPMAISLKKEPILWSESTNLVVENVFKKYTAFGIKPENRLKEVKIIGTKKKQPTVLYGNPDFNYKMDKEGLKFSNTSDLIMNKFPMFDFSTLESPEAFSTIEVEGFPIILIDGNPINELAQLNFVSPEEIEKIEALRGNEILKAMYGPNTSPEIPHPGVISIFTNGNRNKTDHRLHSIKKKIDGFYTARVFYSPNPEQAELENKIAVRNTLYWNPDVRPDKTGNVSVNYYNTKVETKVKVALEGITAAGIPVTKKVYYTIKK